MSDFKIQLKPETIELIRKEIDSIPENFQKPFNSDHEGFAVLWEEVEELKTEMFWGEKSVNKEQHKRRVKEEAVQVAAMAIRIIQELA